MKNLTGRTLKHARKIDWRLTWYSVMVWLVAFVVSGLFALPWFYLVLPFGVLFTTVLYFRFPKKSDISNSYTYSGVFAHGLWLAMLWTSAVFVLDFVEFIGFDLSNFYIYFLDNRNFLKYPVVILIPVIYSLIVEDGLRKKSHLLSSKMSGSHG